jgi:membrane-associated phospholipid phosphatase
VESIWDAGVEVVVAAQGLGQGVRALFQALSFLGPELFFLLLVPLVYWTIDARAGMRIGLIRLISTGVNAFLKLAFAGPRPYWYSDRVLAYAAESSFGLPSGHSQISASVWGMLAVTARRPWFWVLTIALVVLIGISRMYLGVHFPSNVLAGWAIGAALLFGFAALAERAGACLSTRTLGSQVLVAFTTSLVLIAPAWLVVAAQGERQLPEAWTQLAARGDEPLNPWSLDTAASTAGTWFGFVAGLALLSRQGIFNARGSLGRRAARFALGIVVLLLIWFALGQLFPRQDDLVSYSLRYIRYALIGGWVALGAPLAFRRIGL